MRPGSWTSSIIPVYPNKKCRGPNKLRGNGGGERKQRKERRIKKTGKILQMIEWWNFD